MFVILTKAGNPPWTWGTMPESWSGVPSILSWPRAKKKRIVGSRTKLVVVHCEPSEDGLDYGTSGSLSSWTVDSCRMRVGNLAFKSVILAFRM